MKNARTRVSVRLLLCGRRRHRNHADRRRRQRPNATEAIGAYVAHVARDDDVTQTTRLGVARGEVAQALRRRDPHGARRVARDAVAGDDALLAAAHGAVDAYKDLTGDDWKAYEAPAEAKVEKKAATTQMGAFGG